MQDAPITPPRRRRWQRMLLVLVSAALAVFLAIGIFLDRYGQIERAQQAGAIVVLGSQVLADGQPGDSLRERTLHAVALYRQELAPELIFTGGRGSDEPATESWTAAQLAQREGVPANAIFCEEQSTTTRENARYAAEICRAHRITTVILVSDPYHLWRGRRNLAQEGITVYPSPALHCRRNREWPLRLQWTAREALAVIRDVLIGR